MSSSVNKQRKSKSLHAITKQKCLVCQDEEDTKYILHKTRRQTHSMCYACLSSYVNEPINQMIIQAKTGNKITGEIKCSGSYEGQERNRCKMPIYLGNLEFPEEYNNNNLNGKIQVLNLLASLLSAEDYKMNVKLCPYDDCCGLLFTNEFRGVNELPCPQCMKTICVQCGAFPYHNNKSCAEYEIEQGKGLFEVVKNGLVKLCPTCKNPIEKNEGCNKMHCLRCGDKWCWLCRESGIDYDHFNFETGKCAGLLWNGGVAPREVVAPPHIEIGHHRRMIILDDIQENERGHINILQNLLIRGHHIGDVGYERGPINPPRELIIRNNEPHI